MRKVILSILALHFACNGSPLETGTNNDNVKVEYAIAVGVTQTAATILWKCSSKSDGLVLFGRAGVEGAVHSISPSVDQAVVLSNLKPETNYAFQAFCGDPSNAKLIFPQTFRTMDPSVRNRGIWILGGLAAANQPIAEVDLYDPVNDVWFTDVTRVPTPRAFAQILAHKGKIYVLGGMTRNAGIFVPSTIAEEYDPVLDSWRTLASLPTALQGGIAGSSGDEIFLLGGTTTTDMTTGTLANTVYKLAPFIGPTGAWTSFTSSNSIFQRVDMAGCDIDGSIFFTGGRLFSDGSAQSTSDAFLPANNSTSALIEANINVARHGSAYACYRPAPTDANPTDPPALLVIGGSVTANVQQPATSITTTNSYDYYRTGGPTNTFVAGPVLPQALYMASAEISYEKRRLFVFGGSSSVNSPGSSIFSIDLANPVAGPWTTLTTSMPRGRYGHKAVVINR